MTALINREQSTVPPEGNLPAQKEVRLQKNGDTARARYQVLAVCADTKQPTLIWGAERVSDVLKAIHYNSVNLLDVVRKKKVEESPFHFFLCENGFVRRILRIKVGIGSVLLGKTS